MRKSSNKFTLHNFFFLLLFFIFIFFLFLYCFFIYKKMFKDLLAKYHQENKERLQRKKLMKDKIFLKKKQKVTLWL